MPFRRFVTDYLQVYHQDSPGCRVYVRRGWLKRLFYNSTYSQVGERTYHESELPDLQEKAEELARIFHGLYERIAPVFGYSTRPRTRVFVPHSPNGKLLIKTCLELMTGGYHLNEPVEIGKPVGPLLATLKLPQIEVGVGDPSRQERVRMSVVERSTGEGFTLVFNDGQHVVIDIEENQFNFDPAEKTRIGTELSDFLNAQLYSRQEALRIVSCEHQWTEQGEEGPIYHSTRWTVGPSTWESTLADPDFVQTTHVARHSPAATAVGH